MTLPQAIVISRKDTPRVADFKKKIAQRDNLKVIKQENNYKNPSFF